MKIQQAFNDSRIWSGVTCVDYTFSISPSAGLEQIEQSYQALATKLGIDRKEIVVVQQVHGSKVVIAQPNHTEVADGLISATPGIVIGVKLADCCGVLMYDPVCGAVAAVHSGWRGTALNVVDAAIQKLKSDFGSDPLNLRLWLSPCASGEHYEVGEDVYSVLPEYCVPKGQKWLFDNTKAIVEQCVLAGVERENIDVFGSCTITDEQWHSYRRDKELSGRMLAFIGMRS
ncbi:MAG: polyphenol oxidase family protein [Candidatus Kapabacteria bacterium]|nr:polyphenol oxidase family protein [Candidatus Kapabacteria bacterium]